MAIDRTFLLNVAPEFVNEQQSRIDFWIAQAANAIDLNGSDFGNRTDLATAYWVAHMLKIGNLNGSGPVTSERIGEIARSYAASGGTKEMFAATAYGTQFLALQRVYKGPLVT